MPLKILLNGCHGRMGQAIQQLANSFEVDIIAAIGRHDSSAPWDNVDLAIDFSAPSATLPLAKQAAKHQKPLVLGTTGHSKNEEHAIRSLASEIPILWASNFSIGMNILFAMTEHMASLVPLEFQAEIIELHHAFKKDAPSGSASTLAKIIHTTRNHEPKTQDTPIHSLRLGDSTGEHTVLFAGPGERLEISHKSTDRAIFARGALKAAHWILGKPAGLYCMRDVLGL